jgi:hypothetical protein
MSPAAVEAGSTMSASIRRLFVLAAIVGLIGVAVVAILAVAILQDTPTANTATAVALMVGAIAAVVGAVLLYRAQPKPLTPNQPSWAEQGREIQNNFAGLLIVGFLIWIGAYAVTWLFPTSEWAYKWRYAFEDHLSDALVRVDPKPHDCEFMSAPIGSKHCYYEAMVITVRITTTSSGQRLVSYDEGNTWESAAPSTRPAIFVAWQRIND